MFRLSEGYHRLSLGHHRSTAFFFSLSKVNFANFNSLLKSNFSHTIKLHTCQFISDLRYHHPHSSFLITQSSFSPSLYTKNSPVPVPVPRILPTTNSWYLTNTSSTNRTDSECFFRFLVLVGFLLISAISRRRHCLFGLYVRVSVRPCLKNFVSTRSYKPLLGISTNLRCSWGQRQSD